MVEILWTSAVRESELSKSMLYVEGILLKSKYLQTLNKIRSILYSIEIEIETSRV